MPAKIMRNYAEKKNGKLERLGSIHEVQRTQRRAQGAPIRKL